MARHWRRMILAAALLFLPAAFISWRAQRALDDAGTAVRSEAYLRVTVRTLDPVNLPFEVIAAPAGFRDAATFQDSLWLLASDGLFEHQQDGGIQLRFASGRHLPSAPLTALAAGVLAESAEQVLFLATQGAGIAVYDGRSIRQVLPEDARYRRVSCLLPLASGQLLIGTEKGGVLVWNGKNLSYFHESLKDLPVTTMAGQLDDLWIGTMNKGVIHWSAGQSETFGGSLPDLHVLSLAEDTHSVFAGTAVGVAEFRGGKQIRTLADGAFAKSLLPREDTLLVGTPEQGILTVRRNARSAANISAAPPQRVEKLLDLPQGPAALTAGGLAFLNERTGAWSSLTPAGKAILADNNIAALTAEAGGRLWIGYFDRGMDIVEPDHSRATHKEDDVLFCVNRIVLTRDGAAIATANGLVMTDLAGRTRRVFTRNEGLIASHVTDVLVEPDGMVAATPAGITFFTAGGPQSLYAFHGLVNNHVYALAAIGPRILAGTLGGASVLERGSVKASFTTANSALRHNWITALAAVDGEWFAGTYGAGLFRFNGETWHSFPDLRQPFEVNPGAIAVTPSAVYAGTLTRGLAIYNRSNARWSFLESGLPSLNVTAIAASGSHLYIGTGNGLVSIPEASLPLP